MRYPYRGRKGFTLLEIILVLLIAGLAVSVVTLSVASVYEKTVFKEEVKKAFAVLKQARDLSVLQRAVFTFSVDENGGSYSLEKSGSPYGTPRRLPKGVRMKGERIAFFPKGNSTGGGIEITGPKERKYLIEVEPVAGTAKVKRL